MWAIQVKPCGFASKESGRGSLDKRSWHEDSIPSIPTQLNFSSDRTRYYTVPYLACQPFVSGRRDGRAGRAVGLGRSGGIGRHVRVWNAARRSGDPKLEGILAPSLVRRFRRQAERGYGEPCGTISRVVTSPPFSTFSRQPSKVVATPGRHANGVRSVVRFLRIQRLRHRERWRHQSRERQLSKPTHPRFRQIRVVSVLHAHGVGVAASVEHDLL